MMTRTTRPLDEVIGAIRDAKTIALCCHISPDGDTVGSALALRLGLEQLGKQTTLCCQDKIPDILAFLPGADRFCDPDKVEGPFDLLLCVDISDEKRMGRCISLVQKAAHTAQVDHHGTNTRYAQANAVDGSAPANAIIVRELLERLGCEITADMALCLAVGLSTDTGHLVYNSTTPEAYRMMGEMVEAGADIAEAYRRLYRERPVRQVRLLAKALDSLTFHHGGEVTSLHLTRQDFADCGALSEDAEIIVNYGLDIIGVKMCVFAREHGDGVKLSLRSIAPYNVAQVALLFGGGGHAQAAGATVQMPLVETLRQVTAAMAQALEAGK